MHRNTTKSLTVAVILSIMSLLPTTYVVAQWRIKTERDSLMDVAEQWRAASNYTEALNIYHKLSTPQSRIEIASTHLEMGLRAERKRVLSPAEMTPGTHSKITDFVEMALREAQAMRADKEFPYLDDAMLIEARCRQAQGFDAAAKRLYRKLQKKKHAEAMYYYASMLHDGGHNNEALKLCRQALLLRPSLTPAHLLLCDIELSLLHRYQALLPLYRYMLTASDEGRNEAAPLLRSIWRKEPMGMDILGRRKDEEPYSEMMEKKIDEICLQMGEMPSHGVPLIEHLTVKTDSLLSYMRDTGEENLDYYQVAYADFLIEVHARGYVRPMLYYMFSTLYSTEVLLWVNDNIVFFNEFRMWMEGRAWL